MASPIRYIVLALIWSAAYAILFSSTVLSIIKDHTARKSSRWNSIVFMSKIVLILLTGPIVGVMVINWVIGIW